MELYAVDTQHAYERLRQAIIQLELEPGSLIDVQSMARHYQLAPGAVQEALKLLLHDQLIVVAEHRGLYVSAIYRHDLSLLSEIRTVLEGTAARMAAERATPDALTIMRALIEEQRQLPAGDTLGWFEIDHKLHLAIASAAANPHLSHSLEYFFGLSQRLWYLVLEQIDFLPEAVEAHVQLVAAIADGNGKAAEELMQAHVEEFYDRVAELLFDEG